MDELGQRGPSERASGRNGFYSGAVRVCPAKASSYLLHAAAEEVRAHAIAIGLSRLLSCRPVQAATVKRPTPHSPAAGCRASRQ